MKRLFYLDVLRGLAILFMVIDHAYDWWLDAAGQTTFWGRYSEFIGTLAAPLFMFLVGTALALSVTKVGHVPGNRWNVLRNLVRRGLLIFLWGYLLNLLVFYNGENYQDLYAIDILHIIGVSIWLTIPMLWLPTPLVVAAYLLLVFLGQTADVWTLPDWLDTFLTGQSYIINYFPLAHWLPFVYLGHAYGQVIRSGQHIVRIKLALIALGLLSLLLIPLVNPDWGYQHPKPMFVLFSIMVIFWLIVIVWYWTERLARRDLISRSLQLMGKTSMMLYIFHHLVGYRLFYLFGWVHGRSWRGEHGVFAPYQATGLLLGLILLMILVSRWWLIKRSNPLLKGNKWSIN